MESLFDICMAAGHVLYNMKFSQHDNFAKYTLFDIKDRGKKLYMLSPLALYMLESSSRILHGLFLSHYPSGSDPIKPGLKDVEPFL